MKALKTWPGVTAFLVLFGILHSLSSNGRMVGPLGLRPLVLRHWHQRVLPSMGKTHLTRDMFVNGSRLIHGLWQDGTLSRFLFFVRERDCRGPRGPHVRDREGLSQGARVGGDGPLLQLHHSVAAHHRPVQEATTQERAQQAEPPHAEPVAWVRVLVPVPLPVRPVGVSEQWIVDVRVFRVACPNP